MHSELTSKIPQEWKDILEAVQVYFPQAVIAGGALRDLYHDKPVKDIDIFIPVCCCEENLYADQAFQLDPNFKTIATNVYGQEGNEAMPGFRCLYVIYRLTQYSIPVELIFIQAEEDGKNVSSAFDINICQVEYNGNWVTTSIAFCLGVETKIITSCNVNRADRQEGRIRRMKDKYPEYMVLIPEEDIPFDPS